MTTDFLHPGRLWWLLAVALLAAAYVVMQFQRRRHLIRFSSTTLLDTVAPKRPSFGRHAVAALYLLGLTAGVLGIAQPYDEVKVPKQRATIVLALDTSLSMKATDVLPNRLEAAKTSAKHFVDSLPKALNLGLVSFDTGARVDINPTTDREAVKRGIDKLKLHEGTAIGDAVETSLDVISEVPPAENGERVPAVIVLLSDGSTTVGTPTEDAIPVARKAKVPVWTIAYGTPEGVIDVTLPDTGETARVQVPVDPVALERLAKGTGGQAFSAESASDLSAVYERLGSSIGYETEEQEVTWRYLVAAIAALGLSATVSVLVYQRLP